MCCYNPVLNLKFERDCMLKRFSCQIVPNKSQCGRTMSGGRWGFLYLWLQAVVIRDETVTGFIFNHIQFLTVSITVWNLNYHYNPGWLPQCKSHVENSLASTTVNKCLTHRGACAACIVGLLCACVKLTVFVWFAWEFCCVFKHIE